MIVGGPGLKKVDFRFFGSLLKQTQSQCVFKTSRSSLLWFDFVCVCVFCLVCLFVCLFCFVLFCFVLFCFVCLLFR